MPTKWNQSLLYFVMGLPWKWASLIIQVIRLISHWRVGWKGYCCRLYQGELHDVTGSSWMIFLDREFNHPNIPTLNRNCVHLFCLQGRVRQTLFLSQNTEMPQTHFIPLATVFLGREYFLSLLFPVTLSKIFYDGPFK